MRQSGCKAAAVAALAILMLGACARAETPVSPELQSRVQAALADAARRTGLDTSALKVVGAERVTWPDGSLGCPAPGMMYSMALVPGYRIRIQAGTQQLDYHSALSGQPSLCPHGRATDPLPDSRPS